jgi:hypothetical protein
MSSIFGYNMKEARDDQSQQQRKRCRVSEEENDFGAKKYSYNDASDVILEFLRQCFPWFDEDWLAVKIDCSIGNEGDWLAVKAELCIANDQQVDLFSSDEIRSLCNNVLLCIVPELPEKERANIVETYCDDPFIQKTLQ